MSVWVFVFPRKNEQTFPGDGELGGLDAKLEHHGSATFAGKKKRTIFSCCREADALGIQEVLKNGGSPTEPNESGLAPLHDLVQGSGIDVETCIDILLERGADVNQTTTIGGDTCLHLAARNKSKDRAVDIFVKLLSSGADPEIRNKKLRSPYDEAVEKGLVDICAVLDGTVSIEEAIEKTEQKRRDELGERLVRAVISGTEEEIRRAVAQGGTYLNYINKHGAGAIHYVITHCKLDQMKMLELLVETGAEVNLLDYECDSALNLCIKMAHLREGGAMKELVAYLLSVGADKTVQDLDGKDAMMLAEERQYDDIIELLRMDAVERLEPVTEVDEPTESTGEEAESYGLDQILEAIISPEFADDRPGRIEWLVNNGAPVNSKTEKEHFCYLAGTF
ncbi:ankyrin repeat and SOCS box protein 2 [Lingula anatina]|uniref:Ankyrin repeat and SOCS box protein 2 n=1 Tax=Lingula anatina TaxID=7574 RepID=A0A1S3HYQ5_LINAN|nr:ankyrin repeat and SOCS box protein 2 [Lingula anatina]|eukprot:XP_013390214.1 ankyrin repeat and SOCS box protein 2 [Lingula anatina]